METEEKKNKGRTVGTGGEREREEKKMRKVGILGVVKKKSINKIIKYIKK